MYFHASPIKGIEILEPQISNHGVPLIYFSELYRKGDKQWDTNTSITMIIRGINKNGETQ